MIETPTREDWQQWEQNPVTKWYLSKLREERDLRITQVGEGASLRATSDETGTRTHHACGVVLGLNMAIEMEPEEI